MRHPDLVERAAAWLRNTKRCGVVLTEASGGHEIPDAIGWRCGGRVSTLVECKASRADFLRDAQKWHRRHAAHVGIGQERYYMAPAGMLRPDEIPEGWGLVEVTPGGRARVTKRAPEPGKDRPLDREVMAREVAYLYSATRKAQAPERRADVAPEGA